MKKIYEKNLDYYKDIASGLSQNVIICINEDITKIGIPPQITNKECHTFSCSDNWKSKKTEIVETKSSETPDLTFITEYEFNIKCKENCTYYYLDNENKYYCANKLSCPAEYTFVIDDLNECFKDVTILDELKEYEKINLTELTTEKRNEIYNEALLSSEKTFTSGNYDTSNIDKGHDEHLTIGNMRLTFTRVDNQNNNKDDNMTKVHLGKCEDLLRQTYLLPDYVTFYMRIVDFIQDDMEISKIQFDVYCKLDGTSFTKLKLTPCQGKKITLSIPKHLSGDLDKKNASSRYYNDRCLSAKSDSGTDIPLKYRQIDFVVNNRTVCQEDCDFTYYNEKDSLVNCSCNFKDIDITFEDMKIDSNKLYDNFDDTSDKKEISNIGILSCDSLSSTENIKSNPGFLSLIIILAIFIIIFIIFCSKGYNMLETKMIEVIEKKFEKEKEKEKSK